jgi:hypothetical protein
MPMLPVEPGMAKFVGKNVTPPGHGQAFSDINSFCGIVPDSVGVRVPAVHVRIRKLTHGDPIAEWKHDSRRQAQHSALDYHKIRGGFTVDVLIKINGLGRKFQDSSR